MSVFVGFPSLFASPSPAGKFAAPVVELGGIRQLWKEALRPLVLRASVGSELRFFDALLRHNKAHNSALFSPHCTVGTNAPVYKISGTGKAAKISTELWMDPALKIRLVLAWLLREKVLDRKSTLYRYVMFLNKRDLVRLNPPWVDGFKKTPVTIDRYVGGIIDTQAITAFIDSMSSRRVVEWSPKHDILFCYAAFRWAMTTWVNPDSDNDSQFRRFCAAVATNNTADSGRITPLMHGQDRRSAEAKCLVMETARHVAKFLGHLRMSAANTPQIPAKASDSYAMFLYDAYCTIRLIDPDTAMVPTHDTADGVFTPKSLLCVRPVRAMTRNSGVVQNVLRDLGYEVPEYFDECIDGTDGDDPLVFYEIFNSTHGDVATTMRLFLPTEDEFDDAGMPSLRSGMKILARIDEPNRRHSTFVGMPSGNWIIAEMLMHVSCRLCIISDARTFVECVPPQALPLVMLCAMRRSRRDIPISYVKALLRFVDMHGITDATVDIVYCAALFRRSVQMDSSKLVAVVDVGHKSREASLCEIKQRYMDNKYTATKPIGGVRYVKLTVHEMTLLLNAMCDTRSLLPLAKPAFQYWCQFLSSRLQSSIALPCKADDSRAAVLSHIIASMPAEKPDSAFAYEYPLSGQKRKTEIQVPFVQDRTRGYGSVAAMTRPCVSLDAAMKMHDSSLLNLFSEKIVTESVFAVSLDDVWD